MKNKDCTVVVCSCDAYADLLPAFSRLWRRFWADCPFEVVLVTESAPTGLECFDRVIACGKGGSWCSRLVESLRQVATPAVLLLCDDYFLESPVDTELVLRRLSQLLSSGAANLRMIPNPKPVRANSEPSSAVDGLLEYRPFTAYRVATQAGLWDRAFLAALAAGKSSIWEFERYGSFDPAASARRMLVTPSKEFPFVDAVHKGHWETWGLEVCRANGIDVSGTGRTLPPLRVRITEGLKGMAFRLLPTTALVKFQNRFSLGAKEKPQKRG